jgi:hypothetical protein
MCLAVESSKRDGETTALAKKTGVPHCSFVPQQRSQPLFKSTLLSGSSIGALKQSYSIIQIEEIELTF